MLRCFAPSHEVSSTNGSLFQPCYNNNTILLIRLLRTFNIFSWYVTSYTSSQFSIIIMLFLQFMRFGCLAGLLLAKVRSNRPNAPVQHPNFRVHSRLLRTFAKGNGVKYNHISESLPERLKRYLVQIRHEDRFFLTGSQQTSLSILHVPSSLSLILTEHVTSVTAILTMFTCATKQYLFVPVGCLS
jgi:hypothetical protein